MSLLYVAATLAVAADGDTSSDVDFQKVSADCAALIMTCSGVLGAASANALIALMLRLVGFTVAGVAKGSFAAWWQSTMPLVSAGSVFAKLTSIAMSPAGAGAAGTTIGGIFGVGGGAVAAGFSDVCKRVDEEVARRSVVGVTLQANTRMVQAALSSVEGATKTAKQVYDAVPPTVKDLGERIAKQAQETVTLATASLVDSAGRAYEAVSHKASEAAEATGPALVTAAKATGEAVAASSETASKTAKAMSGKAAEVAAAAVPVVEEKLKQASDAAKHVFEGLLGRLRSRL
mmetsp:Transcript_406/g.748  ORF Transcript_406/g.748 Transcript_406/m.748 type:complete len:290 (+) Transcript_406:3-872(+)